MVIDAIGRRVFIDGQEIRFTRREYDLLVFFATHAGAAFTRMQLLRAVWGHEFSGERTVDVHIRRIRVKMGVHGDAITTVHGFGYRLDNRHNMAGACAPAADRPESSERHPRTG